MLKIHDLEVGYKKDKKEVKVLGPLNFQIGQGEIVGVIGPSGCGKTTLLNVLAGVNKNYLGQVSLNDSHGYKVGYIPQHYGLLPWMTVRENCRLPFKIGKDPSVGKDPTDEFFDKRLNKMMTELGLEGYEGSYPNQLSGGQRQRVAIARALLMKPDLMLMDEPFSSLDAIRREEARDIFLKMWSKYKTTTLFVTHDIDEALFLGQRILVLSNVPGNIIKVIDNQQFGIKTERHSDIKSLLDEVAGHV